MLAKDIKIGGVYEAKVSNILVPVKVLDIRECWTAKRGAYFRYDCVNQETGRKIVVKSAARFRGPWVSKAVENLDLKACECCGAHGEWREIFGVYLCENCLKLFKPGENLREALRDCEEALRDYPCCTDP